MSDRTYWTAGRTAAALREGTLTSEAAVRDCIDRIERHDGLLNAVCVRRFDDALAEARAADEARAAGSPARPLHGVPITVKEGFDLAGTASTWGLEHRRDHRAERDAEAVRRLREAGAVVLGKTNVPPNLADWHTENPVYGRTANPWNPERTPGGSSGGSAVSLAAGYAYLELGSDIGGSLRNPAHFCGVCAHKPTYGIVPLDGYGIVDLQSPTDIAVGGPMARTVADLELGLAVLAGPGPRDARAWRFELPPPRRERLEDCRVAVVVEEPVCRVAASVRAAVRRAGEICAEAGAAVDFDVELPFDTRHSHEIYIQLLRGAMVGSFDDETLAAEAEVAAAVGPEDRSYRAQLARAYTQAHWQWQRTDAERWKLKQAWAELFARYDVLLCPAAPTAAFPHDTSDRLDRKIDVDGDTIGYYDELFWVGVTGVAGLPSTVIPAGLSPEGLPVGVQIVAGDLEDRTALAVAGWVEREEGGFRVPPGYD